jgi:TctA family transporter
LHLRLLPRLSLLLRCIYYYIRFLLQYQRPLLHYFLPYLLLFLVLLLRRSTESVSAVSVFAAASAIAAPVC